MPCRLVSPPVSALAASVALAATIFSTAPARAGVPILPGDTFRYAYTVATTFQVTGQKPQRATSHATFSVAVSANASFAGRKNLTKFHYFGLTGAVSDEYVGFVTAAPGVLQERKYGSVLDAPPSVTTQTVPAGAVVAEYPEAKGRSWSPAADSQSVDLLLGRSSPDNITSFDYADGSYRWSEYIGFKPNAERATGTQASDGSANTTGSVPGYAPSSTSFGVPVSTKRGFVIPVMTSSGNNSTTVDVPDWFPGRALPLRPLHGGVATNEGVTLTPAACGARAGIAAFDVHATATTLDPLRGTLQYVTSDEYDASGLGNACTISTTIGYSYFNSNSGTLASHGTTTSITILQSIAGPKPNAQPFSLDVTPGVQYQASYHPAPG
jgi:hypothetical protein